jgi:hypothetical protein
MDNSTQVIFETDFDEPFSGLLTTRPFKVFSMLFSSFSVPVNVFLLYGVIWFERYGTDKKRTLMNKLVASQCWFQSKISVFLVRDVEDR